jgi:hypothetical protein
MTDEKTIDRVTVSQAVVSTIASAQDQAWLLDIQQKRHDYDSARDPKETQMKYIMMSLIDYDTRNTYYKDTVIRRELDEWVKMSRETLTIKLIVLIIEHRILSHGLSPYWFQTSNRSTWLHELRTICHPVAYVWSHHPNQISDEFVHRYRQDDWYNVLSNEMTMAQLINTMLINVHTLSSSEASTRFQDIQRRSSSSINSMNIITCESYIRLASKMGARELKHAMTDCLQNRPKRDDAFRLFDVCARYSPHRSCLIDLAIEHGITFSTHNAFCLGMTRQVLTHGSIQQIRTWKTHYERQYHNLVIRSGYVTPIEVCMSHHDDSTSEDDANRIVELVSDEHSSQPPISQHLFLDNTVDCMHSMIDFIPRTLLHLTRTAIKDYRINVLRGHCLERILLTRSCLDDHFSEAGLVCLVQDYAG